MAPMMAASMGSERARLHHDHVPSTSAGTTTPRPWRTKPSLPADAEFPLPFETAVDPAVDPGPRGH